MEKAFLLFQEEKPSFLLSNIRSNAHATTKFYCFSATEESSAK